MTLPHARYIVLQHEGVWKINLDNKYYGPFPTQAQAVDSASGTARKAADAKRSQARRSPTSYLYKATFS